MSNKYREDLLNILQKIILNEKIKDDEIPLFFEQNNLPENIPHITDFLYRELNFFENRKEIYRRRKFFINNKFIISFIISFVLIVSLSLLGSFWVTQYNFNSIQKPLKLEQVLGKKKFKELDSLLHYFDITSGVEIVNSEEHNQMFARLKELHKEAFLASGKIIGLERSANFFMELLLISLFASFTLMFIYFCYKRYYLKLYFSIYALFENSILFFAFSAYSLSLGAYLSIVGNMNKFY